MENRYDDADRMREKVISGRHRQLVGGKWGEIGRLQFNYLKSKGLKPEHYLLDVGCGSLRGGVHFVSYLEAFQYFGFDKNEMLIAAGVEVELKNLKLDEKVKPGNFASSEDFQYPADWPQMDFAIGFSIITHLGEGSAELCLQKTATQLKPGGIFYVTVFEVPDEEVGIGPYLHKSGIQSWAHKDPFHYTFGQLEALGEKAGLTLTDIEEFNHPRGQKMAVFEKAAQS
jgi:SAM-dependent methyltransferase